MAAEEAKVVGAVPPPPAYYKLFAPDAVGAGGEGTATAFPLEPPRPPGPGETYKMFGMPYSSEPITEELLPPEKIVVPISDRAIDFRKELKALLNSIMANYGQFMEMLISSPSRAHEKLSDVETLFVNFHSLLNRYRAHQARHLLLERLRSQAQQNAAVASALEAAMLECLSAHEGAIASLETSRSATKAGDAMDVEPGVGEDQGVPIHGREGVNGLGSGSGPRDR